MRCITCCVAAAASVAAHELDIRASYFGPPAAFANFWGTRPVLQVWLENGGVEPLGRKLWRTNDTWLSENLPMLPLAQAGADKELAMPFSDRISAVRILGGWATKNPDGTFTPHPENDVVTRDASGLLEYNWTELDSRLEAWVAAGIRPSPFVLDNIPYAFVRPENQFFHKLGLGSAPDDPVEFGKFVEAMVAHLVERFGADEVSSWRFRLGTESENSRMGPIWTGPSGNGQVALTLADGSSASFSNGLRQYLDTYDAAARAVKRVSPASGFGPCNFAALAELDGSTDYDKQLRVLADELHEKDLPMDFAAVSQYSLTDRWNNSPAQSMAKGVRRVAQIARRAHTGSEGGQGSPVPVEAMEYGWANWQPHNAGAHPPLGAWGAAWNAASFLWMREGGADQVFQWYGFDRSIGDANRSYCNTSHAQVGRPLVDGFGWTMAMLELLKGGGHPEVNHDTVGASFVRDVPSVFAPAGRPYNKTFGAWRAAQGASQQLHYLLVLFSSNSTADERETTDIVLRVGATDFPDPSAPWFDLASALLPGGVSVTQRVLSTETAVHDKIHHDLAEVGELVPETAANVPFEVKKMATAAGLALAAQEAERYMEINAASLQAWPFSGEVAYDKLGQELVLTIKGARPPLVQVISLSSGWAFV